jgi:hypothetical protein
MRRKALAVGDEELELVEFADEPEMWFVCMHSAQSNKEIGPGESDGAGCPLFEAPSKSGLDPDLEKLLARRAGR